MAKVTRELPLLDRDNATSLDATSLDSRAPGGGLPIQGGVGEGTMRASGFGLPPGAEADADHVGFGDPEPTPYDGGAADHPVHDADEEDATPELFEAQMDDIELAARGDFAALLEDEVENPDTLASDDRAMTRRPATTSSPPFDHDPGAGDRTTIGRDQDERP